ncbi:MAG: hypothetical protein AMXMBFR64_00110 [Myxococcales bacterium]
MGRSRVLPALARRALRGLGPSLLAALGALPLPAQAQAARGFAEVRFQADIGVDGTWWSLVERVRPELEAEIVERLHIAVLVEGALTQGRRLHEELERTLRASPVGPLLDACTFPEPDNEVLGVSSAGDYLRVERLYLDLYLPWVDLRLGRQAVQWGSALLVNPTDPFPEVLLTEPWRFRAGVNALRATFPIGESHDVALVVGANDDFTAARIAAKARLGLESVDLALLGAWRQEAGDGMVGLDIRGTLEVGYWLEGALFIDEDLRVHEELAIGLDTSFPVLDSLVVALQYYRNGGGSADVKPTGALAGGSSLDCPALGVSAPEPDPFAPALRGTDYALLSMMLAAIPELSVSALWLQNLGDGTGLVVPTVTALPTGWLEVALAAQVPFQLWGDGGELSPSDDVLLISLGAARVDLSGLVPAATLSLWTRVHF